MVESWINVNTNLITRVDHKKSGFRNNVAIAFNRYTLEGATKKIGKICSIRWNRASPLVSKWCGSVGEAYRTNPSGANEDTIMKLAHELYQNKVGKWFDVDGTTPEPMSDRTIIRAIKHIFPEQYKFKNPINMYAFIGLD